MNENLKLKKTHQHLTLVFTGVVFAIVTIIGISLIVTKYISEIQFEKREFKDAVSKISFGIENQEHFLENFFLIGETLKGKKLPEFKGGKGPNRVSFYVIDKTGSIIFENLLEEPNFDSLDFEKEKTLLISGDYVYQKEMDDSLVVFYSNVKTEFSDFLEDVGLLFALCIVFSGLFYFVGYKFVGRALVPVQKNMQDMQDFIHNAGHELKTPLAVMRGNLQLMQALESFDRELIGSSVRNVDTMTNLIESLRELSEVGKNVEKTEVSLQEIVTKVFERYTPSALEKNISLESKIPKSCHIFANENELQILIANLISNAIRYNVENGKVLVGYKKNIFFVEDTGIGIPEEIQEKIYDRFFQGNSVRSKQGFGIGLSLVKKICDINGWKISLSSEQNKGSRFELIFS